jgi:hypothetical protein
MTNKFLGVFIALFLSLVFQAQAQKFGIGVKGGLNFATSSGNSTFGLSSTSFSASALTSNFTGFNGGIYAIIPFGALMGLQVEANYMQQGYKATGSSANNLSISFDETRTLNYFQVPLLARLSFGTDLIKVWGNAGLYGAFLSNASLKSSVTAAGGITGNFSTTSFEQDVTKNIKGFDFGGVIGAGVGYGVGKGYITLDARYNYGFVEIHDSQISLSSLYNNTASGQNRVITVSLGYLFTF